MIREKKRTRYTGQTILSHGRYKQQDHRTLILCPWYFDVFPHLKRTLRRKGFLRKTTQKLPLAFSLKQSKSSATGINQSWIQ